MNKPTALAIVTAQLALASSVIMATGGYEGTAYAAENCYTAEWLPMPCPNEVRLSDIPDIDSLPICTVEDCSDQPGQVGLWLDRDTGNWWLSRGETEFYVIMDDTAVR